MFYHKFQLTDKYPTASLTAFVCDQTIKCDPRPAVVVCPGGGYSFVSPREAEPIVRKLLAAEYNVYLLDYTCKEGAANYAPLIQAALSIKLVRERAAEDNTNPEQIYVMGFSAGGHLAASSGILWNIPEVRDAIGVTDGKCPEGINRPDGMILCYPVIVGNEFTHKTTLSNFSGTTEITDEHRKKFSLDLHVDSTTPPAFIWHTFTDKSVPVQNSLMLMDALAANGIPFESHIYPFGAHGLSLATKECSDGNEGRVVPYVEGWIDLVTKWVKYEHKI